MPSSFPIISAYSLDTNGNQQLWGKEVLASVVVKSQPTDAFFYPAEWGLTGYDAKGRWYEDGERATRPGGVTHASWWSWDELNLGVEFPLRTLVLVTDYGISLLDLSHGMRRWLISLRGDDLGFTNQIVLSHKSGCRPHEVVYNRGVISVICSPDPGSQYQVISSINFDFLNDRIYVDTAIPVDTHMLSLKTLPIGLGSDPSQLISSPVILP